MQAGLAAIVGAIMAGGAVLAWHISDRQRHTLPQVEEPVIQAGAGAVLAILRSSAVVVDESDHVLKASAPAYAFGLVRGDTVLVPELLDIVAQVRRDGQIRESDIDLPATDGGIGWPVVATRDWNARSQCFAGNGRSVEAGGTQDLSVKDRLPGMLHHEIRSCPFPGGR